MYHTVGKRVERVDGYEKVSGKAVYGDDIRLPGMLYAAQRYTDFPSAIIKKIDISEALRVSGVKKIILQDDIPGQKKLGHLRADQYVLIKDQSVYSGDVIAVVVAETREEANAAADLIKVEYEPLEGIFDVMEALKPEARLIHPEFKSNTVLHYPLRKGNVEKGFAGSEHVIEREYNTGFAEHAYIEPESVIAEPDQTCRGVRIYGSIQNPFTTRKNVAKALNLKLNQVNVFGSNIGGSFGGKDDISFILAARCGLLAMMTGKPVKITLGRENSFKESYKRHPYRMNYKIGFNQDGKINAMKINILADSGAYSSMSFFVTWRSVVQATGPYEIPNVETDVTAVYTNNTYTAAFRGFGSPQIVFAQESLMDEVASLCGKSPYEIRMLNGFRQGSETASGQALSRHTVSLKQVIDKALETSGYEKKTIEYAKLNMSSERFKHGIGFACSYRGCCLGAEGVDATSALVSVLSDGTMYVLTGLNENGQGLRTTFCQIAAEILGVDYRNVHFIPPQTAAINDGGPTVASRSTLMGGQAVKLAATEVKNRIFDVIKDTISAKDISETEWKDGVITAENGRKISFAEAAFKAQWAGVNLSAYGWHNAPKVSWTEETGQGDAYFTYVYGCQIADITVDTHTGKIEINRITAAHDVGRAINLTGVEGQIYGGVTQGAGYGIWEHYNIQHGDVKTENFDEYIIPTIKDIREIIPVIVENPDPDGPFGAKCIGEPTLELGSAAINNALYCAAGKRYYEIPLTLEKVFLGRQLVKPSRSSELSLGTKIKKQSPRINDVTTKVSGSLNDALTLISKGEYRLMAGGTDVVVQLRKQARKTRLLHIGNLPELKGMIIRNGKIEIGGGVTISQILSNGDIRKYFPVLYEAVSKLGGNQTRNMATIAGNIVNAAPCADSVPPLIAYGAEVVLESLDSQRVIPLQGFITGTYKTQIRGDEILTKVIIPVPQKPFRHSYYQLGRRNAMSITRQTMLVLMAFNHDGTVDECRIVHGSMLAVSGRMPELEKMFVGRHLTTGLIESTIGRLKDMIQSEIGGRWSSEYKMPVFINMYRDALVSLLSFL